MTSFNFVREFEGVKEDAEGVQDPNELATAACFNEGCFYVGWTPDEVWQYIRWLQEWHRQKGLVDISRENQIDALATCLIHADEEVIVSMAEALSATCEMWLTAFERHFEFFAEWDESDFSPEMFQRDKRLFEGYCGVGPLRKEDPRLVRVIAVAAQELAASIGINGALRYIQSFEFTLEEFTRLSGVSLKHT